MRNHQQRNGDGERRAPQPHFSFNTGPSLTRVPSGRGLLFGAVREAQESGGFSLPWRSGDDAKAAIGKDQNAADWQIQGFQSQMLEKLKDQASAAITRGVSGVLTTRT